MFFLSASYVIFFHDSARSACLRPPIERSGDNCREMFEAKQHHFSNPSAPIRATQEALGEDLEKAVMLTRLAERHRTR